MVAMTASARRRDGVTLVTATIEGEPEPTRIRVENRLDGPIWPPRRQGRPAAGWHCDCDGGDRLNADDRPDAAERLDGEDRPDADVGDNDNRGDSDTHGDDGDGSDDGHEGCFEGVVPADGRLAIGFASPAEPLEEPLAVTRVEPAPAPSDEMATPDGVVRGLGDPSPPSLADDLEAADVAAGESDRDDAGENRRTGSPANDLADPGDAAGGQNDSGDDGDHRGAGGRNDGRRNDGGQNDGGRDGPTAIARRPAREDDSLPPELDCWFGAIERRIDCAEGLQADAGVTAAAAALRDCGGVDGARALDARLASDARVLRAIERRAATLADRAETTTVATDALDRLP